MITLASSFLLLLLHKTYEPTHTTVIIEGVVHGDVIVKGNGTYETKSMSHTNEDKAKRNSISHMKKAVKCEDRGEEFDQGCQLNKAYLGDVETNPSPIQNTDEELFYSADGNQDHENEMSSNKHFEHTKIKTAKKFALTGKELIVADQNHSLDQDKMDTKTVLGQNDDQSGSIYTNSDMLLLQPVDPTRSVIPKEDNSAGKLGSSLKPVHSKDISTKQSGRKQSTSTPLAKHRKDFTVPTLYTEDPVQTGQHPAIPQLKKEQFVRCTSEEGTIIQSNKVKSSRFQRQIRDVTNSMPRKQQPSRYEKVL